MPASKGLLTIKEYALLRPSTKHREHSEPKTWGQLRKKGSNRREGRHGPRIGLRPLNDAMRTCLNYEQATAVEEDDCLAKRRSRNVGL